MLPSNQLQTEIARFEAFLQADPANPHLLRELGERLHHAGRLDEALACFRQITALTPDSAIARSRIASVYLSQGQFGEASTALAELIAGGDTSPALQHNLGLALYYQDRYADAALAFQAAQAGGITDAANAKYLAHCLHHEGELDAAAAACEQWVQAADGPESKGYLSLLAFDQGERARAGALASAVLDEQPDSIDANAVAGSLALEEQQMDVASRCFARILSQRQDNGRAWLGMGLTYLHAEQHSQAIDAMSRASTCMPGHAGTLVALGWTRLNAGDAAGAEVEFRRAIGADRNFAETHGGLAAALVHLQRIDEAKQAITVANKLDARNFGAIYARAAMLKLDGEASLADRLVMRALQQSALEGTPSLSAQLARFLQMRGKI